MSEIFPVHESHEQRQQALASHAEIGLHNGQIDIDINARPLMSQTEAVEVYGINGDILATITLPSEHEAREIAIVDYGEPDAANPKPITVFEGQPMPVMGKARERYGLRALNYTPEGHLSSHVGFNDGATINIGRENAQGNKDANYKLGLSDGSPENELISRKHATISIQNGKMTISDSSTNGSLVRVASQEQSETLPTSGEIHADLGSRALQGAEVALKETKEQQPVQDNYVNLAAAANKLSQGNIEPSILIGQMKRILETMPDEEREALGDIRMLVDSVVDEHGRQIDRYRTGSVARQIETAVRQHMQQR